ncbi:MAG TPA: LEA type 2 family protein [Candidatus Coprenecus stercoravium]|uniref:Type IV secretion system putative lipoprotein virB7 n=1 Tax=Candidatus Coprenecus stercoravium TaxID=2840735 RepID=A0A9D2GPW8_9BACT|nr:LEA type 2 family protein [Candidatus Coprenecus stercoravium]
MRRIVFFAVAVMLLAGCADYRQLRVDDVSIGSLRFNGTSSAVVELKAGVYNPTKYEVSVRELDALLLKEGKEFARFSLEDIPSVAADTQGVVSIPVRASVLDPIAIISSGLNFGSWDMDDFTVDGKIVIAFNGGMKKTVRLNNVPVRDIIQAVK